MVVQRALIDSPDVQKEIKEACGLFKLVFYCYDLSFRHVSHHHYQKLFFVMWIVKFKSQHILAAVKFMSQHILAAVCKLCKR